MKKKGWLACVLAVVLTVAAVASVPVYGEAAAKKPAKPNITGNAAYVTEDNVGIQFSWDKVKGAKGYQYRYNVMWKGSGSPSKYTTKTTTKTKVKVGFQDNKGVYFQVRAYKTTKVNKKTKNVYGKWATVKLKEKTVSELIEYASKVDLNGSWQDSVSQRASMDMGVIGDGTEDFYLAIITWGSGATEPVTTWNLSGKFDQATGVFTYEGGTQYEVSYDSNGEESSRKEIKKDLAGTMTYDFETGKITWNDSTSITGLEADMLFEKV